MDHHAYVRFHDHHAAEQAFHVMDGRTLFGKVSFIHDFLLGSQRTFCLSQHIHAP